MAEEDERHGFYLRYSYPDKWERRITGFARISIPYEEFKAFLELFKFVIMDSDMAPLVDAAYLEKFIMLLQRPFLPEEVDSSDVDEWNLTGPCPQCGSKTSWRPNYVMSRENKTFEVGQYHCNKCSAKSGVHETETDWDGAAHES